MVALTSRRADARHNDGGDHVAGEHERSRARQQAEDEQQAADDLDHIDRVDERIGGGQAEVLERRHLGGVLGELADAEDDEHRAADHARHRADDRPRPADGPATSRSATAATAAQRLAVRAQQLVGRARRRGVDRVVAGVDRDLLRGPTW